jgi:hypothetical protein
MKIEVKNLQLKAAKDFEMRRHNIEKKITSFIFDDSWVFGSQMDSDHSTFFCV